MGDELPSLPGLDDGTLLSTAADAESAQTGLQSVSSTVDECAAIVAETEDALTKDITDCLNNCHGDIGLCHSCILGDIADYINRAGLTVTSCGQKIVKAVNDVMSEAWQSGIAAGVPPPSDAQIQAALAGQVIPEAAAPPLTTGTISEDGGQDNTGITPPITVIGDSGAPGTILTSGPTQTQVITLPRGADGNPCIPYEWTPAQITNAARSIYGQDPFGQVTQWPTQEQEGIWRDSLGDHPIPKLCVAQGGTTIIPPPETITVVPPGTGTIVTINPPPGGIPGQIVTVPTAPPQSGAIQNVSCPPPLITVNVPPCPTLAPPSQQPTSPGQTIQSTVGKTPRCIVCYGNGTAQVLPADDPQLAHLPDGAFITGCASDDASLVQLGLKCGINIVLPPEPPPPPPTPVQPVPPGLLACDPDNIDAAVKAILVTIPNITSSPFALSSSYLGVSGDKCPDGFFSALSHPLDTIGCVAGKLVDWMFASAPWLTNLSTLAGTQGACNLNEYSAALVSHALFKFVNQWTAILPPSMIYQMEGGLNYCYQYRIPTSAEASAAYARGYLSQEQAEFTWRFNGDCVPWQRKLQESHKTRIGIQDAYRLWRLGQLTDVEMTEAWKRQGIDTEKEFSTWQNAVQQYPGMADLIRMMVRDVGDPSVVQLLGLDEEFAQKWTDSPGAPLQTWGKAQGISDDVAKLFWRAHWQAPSPQQIYVWLQRFRPDDRDPRDPHPEVVMTEEQAAKLLQIADYVPGLVKNYIAAAYRPITRRDISRLYRIGVLADEDAVRRAFRDIGSSPIAAKDLARATTLTEAPAKAKLEGELTPSDVLSQYRNNLLTRDEAEPLLKTAGLSQDQLSTSLNAADVKKRAASRTIVVKSLRARYFKGEFTDAEASQQLSDAFMALGQAADTVKLWAAERQAREKSPTIALLCKWYGQGQISLEDYLKRVQNLNYSTTDALRIVESCNFDIQQRRQKEIERALAAQQKVQQAANRELAKQLREAKQAARALKLQHIVTHKRVVKDANGKFTTTITDTFTDKPDVNVTSTDQNITVSDGQPTS